MDRLSAFQLPSLVQANKERTQYISAVNAPSDGVISRMSRPSSIQSVENTQVFEDVTVASRPQATIGTEVFYAYQAEANWFVTNESRSILWDSGVDTADDIHLLPFQGKLHAFCWIGSAYEAFALNPSTLEFEQVDSNVHNNPSSFTVTDSGIVVFTDGTSAL